MFILVYGAIMKPSILWETVDICVALLGIVNTFAMLKLRKEVYNEYKKEVNYDR